MSSYAKQIGDAIVTVIQGLSGAPSLVQLRKENVLLSREEITEVDGAVIVAVGLETPVNITTGGTIFKEYIARVMYARKNPGKVATELDTNPAFVLRMKQALDITSLAGVPVVWSVDLIEAEEWEEDEFGKAAEVSTFGLKVHTNEPRNG